MRGLLALGLSYGILILYRASSGEGLEAAETFWIQELRTRGFALTNITDGGDGWTRGKPKPPHEQERLRKLRVGIHTPQATLAAAEVNRGKKRPPFSVEWKQKIATAARSRGPHSEEHKRKIADGGRGRVHSEETKAKMRVAALAREERKRVHGSTTPFKSTSSGGVGTVSS